MTTAVEAKRVGVKTPFSSIEKKILSSFNGRQIRLERTLKNKKETLERFLIDFFTKWNQENKEDSKNTIWVDTEEVQTPAGRRRSLGDIFMLCRYYYPNCTLQEVISVLYYLSTATGYRGFRTMNCRQINKRVWHYVPDKNSMLQHEDESDEYGHRVEYYLNRI